MMPPKMRIAIPAMLALGLCAVSAPSNAQAVRPTDQAAQKIAASVCVACHGPAGVSTSPLFPHLAGQSQIYLVAQLKAFKGKARGEKDAHDYMWGMATLLEDTVMEDLARYYAAQNPARGVAGDPALAAQGRTLFDQGDPTLGIVACASCHGTKAEGNSIFPRLAGQHASYVVRQLEVIQGRSRDSPVMHGVIKDLDAHGMKAVAEYVQSL